MSKQEQDVMDFFAGGGPPILKFETIGTTYKGKIIGEEIAPCTDADTGKPELWPNGQPKMQAILTLMTDLRDEENEEDDGKRRLFAKSYMKMAIRDAIKESKFKGRSLVGGELTIEYGSNGKKTKPTHSAPKFYKARYIPPSLMDESEGEPEDNWG